MKQPTLLITLIVGLVALAAGLWVSLVGVNVDRDIPAATMAHETGLAFLAPVPGIRRWAGHGDSLDSKSTSNLRLFDDNRELGPPHSMHADIRAMGHGMFSHWSNSIYLSSSDGTDPKSNGRTYHVRYSAYPASGAPKLLTLIALIVGALLSAGSVALLVIKRKSPMASEPSQA